MIPEIRISDYDYELPDGRIAKYPLERRDASKLLVYKNGNIAESVFRQIPDFLPSDSLMVFNDTKVVPARLHFMKPTGAHIEIFCLEPCVPAEYNLIFSETCCCRWKCIVGNVKRWKSGRLTLCNPELSRQVEVLGLEAEMIERDGETSVIEFTWKDGSPFSRVLEICGTIPIPPYLNRDSESIDSERYQTLYARYRGSVAAPTAGLHFTEEVLAGIKAKGIDMETVCLHVGAGTFLPVKSVEISGHTMHREPFSVSVGLLEKLRDRKSKVIAVGTTSVRTLESIYYAGVKCIEEGRPSDISQWMPYEREYGYSFEEAADALAGYLKGNSMDSLKIGTRIIIVPGFRFRAVDVLVTNFHQPQSTLLLLISAFVGGNWKEIYDYALSHDFRFLSYGDSSLLFREQR
ncbi:MAG: S-adenosylmethionine:tRNA ribosyltransferase-isomerase [Bacteroidetes bacterium]|uniref:S-adenosylmethionine:tRNA ribosyltransferase-isomerase n=1 Tax=Candidatus Cryptobacteroides merdavium TaxID=2840769 RepID=A0A9D9HCH5_9BACT|nr:S-adenosylmethionine:tRNA ribosyltransferase-isomerase [Candidatus Cryptobacteroides merdavium]